MNTYTAKRVTSPIGMNDPRWEKAEAVSLDHRWMDCDPSPYTTTARLVHCDGGVTVLLSSNEWPILAENTACNGRICDDSCMEFFFTPNGEDKSYINLEVNPHGLTHVGFGEGRHNRTLLNIEDKGLRIETLIRPREGWSVCLFVPYTFIKEHFTAPTAAWRANFYKCGEKTVVSHFQTWNPVGTEKPDYHRPEYFGNILLSDEVIG